MHKTHLLGSIVIVMIMVVIRIEDDHSFRVWIVGPAMAGDLVN